MSYLRNVLMAGLGALAISCSGVQVKEDPFKEVEDSPEVGEKEWLAQMRKRYKEVVDCEEFYKLDILKGFAFGFPITTDGKNWNFTNSPSGKRYYFHN